MPASAQSGDRRSPWRHLAALLVLVIAGVLMWTSERHWSITADEPVHFLRGHAYWWTDSARLSTAHPPLGNAITSLPFAFDGDEPWKADQPEGPSKVEFLVAQQGFAEANPLPLALAYLSHDFASARAELTWARRVMMLWTLVFAASLYLWCDRRWGFATGIVALILACSHPTLLAHGQLVTTDLPATATTFWMAMAWIAWLERPNAARIALFTLAASAMILTKHSGLALMLVFAPTMVISAWFGWAGFAGVSGSRLRRTAQTGLSVLFVACVMLFALAAAYQFERVGMRVSEILAEPEPRSWISKRHHYAMFERTPIAALPGWLRLPVPYDWLAGLATVAAQNDMGHGDYFFGVRDEAGHPAYFPVLLFAKTPVGLLVLLAAALGLLVARRHTLVRTSVATRVLLLIAIVSLAGACASRINIGVRHVLPGVPIMIVFAARAAALLWERGRWWSRALVLACLVASGVGAASTYPRWLADFNVLVGGETGGHAISMVGEDWGQDVQPLIELAHERGWKRLRYVTKFAPRRYELTAAGIQTTRLKCKTPYHGRDPVVIHATDWVRYRESCYAWLGEPDIVINHHILVFLPPERVG
ncbi:ArnT family glycosyltransferase [Nannocystaceae bacterium ST9]